MQRPAACGKARRRSRRRRAADYDDPESRGDPMLYPRLAAALLFALPALAATAFDLQGHRGARGLAPENTLPAFERALAVGVSSLELDIALTADGVVVVSHDPRLNPVITRDATGRWLAGAGPRLHDLR